MNGETIENESSLQEMYKSGERRLGWWQIGANLIGACTVTSYFIFFDQIFPVLILKNTIYVVGLMFPLLCAIAARLMHGWQKDLVRFIRLKAQGRNADDNLRSKARRKILNLPLISAVVSLLTWFLAGITMTTYSFVADTGASDSLTVVLIGGVRVFVGCMIGGIVVASIIFFITEARCRQIWPLFFPYGGLAKMTGVFRLNLRTRMLVIFILASILPLILMGVLSYNKARMMLIINPADVIQSLLYLTAFLLTVTLAIALILSRQFSTGIIDPVRRMEAAMAKVERGDLTATVVVDRNDELGFLAENFNQMTDGLKDRYRLRQALDLAKEVQQSLLPKGNPQFAGLDIGGISIYCDETGGDYFDFIGNDNKQLNVVIGDVSGHGISSAILMASVRAFLRQRAHLPGNLSRMLSDVNRQLVADVEDSCNFMTLFYLRIDPVKGKMQWIRAGHDPAILYNPFSDRFSEMHGKSPVLGVDARAEFEENEKTGLIPGHIVVLATDGVWEARNKDGDMFGKEPLYQIIRQNKDAEADDILGMCFQSLEEFQTGAVREDDITMVVIKVVSIESSKTNHLPT